MSGTPNTPQTGVVGALTEYLGPEGQQFRASVLRREASPGLGHAGILLGTCTTTAETGRSALGGAPGSRH